MPLQPPDRWAEDTAIQIRYAAAIRVDQHQNSSRIVSVSQSTPVWRLRRQHGIPHFVGQPHGDPFSWACHTGFINVNLILPVRNEGQPVPIRRQAAECSSHGLCVVFTISEPSGRAVHTSLCPSWKHRKARLATPFGLAGDHAGEVPVIGTPVGFSLGDTIQMRVSPAWQLKRSISNPATISVPSYPPPPQLAGAHRCHQTA